MINFSCK